MFAVPHLRHRDVFQTPDHLSASEAARRSNRRRLNVFLVVFLATLLPGLAWNFLRPAEYRSNARIEIAPGSVSPRHDQSSDVPPPAETGKSTTDILTQVQILNSRSLLEEVQRRLSQEGQAVAGADPIAELQNIVSVTAVPATNIVELQAVGPTPQRLAPILNTLIDAYRDRLFATHGDASKDTIANLREETERLGNAIAEQRAKLQAFRARTGVVSSERSENESLARIKGLAESLNKANEDAAKAEAKLRSLRESAASGWNSGNARDNPTLAAVEQRISATREQLRDMERTYTPEFMAMDPTARALRARLAELEQQQTTTRSANQQAALAAAEEEAASTRAAVERLRAQIGTQRREAQDFSGNFQQAQTMEDDLKRLEAARRNAMERLAKLEASEGARLPSLKLVEAANLPQQPWRPAYLRDAFLNLGISFALGLLAMWFVELFNREPAAPASSTVIVPQPWMAPAPLAMAGPLPHHDPLLAAGPAALPQLPAAAPPVRELSQGEVSALLAAADGEASAVCALLLLGVTVQELCRLTVADIDPANGTVKVGGISARTLKLPNWLSQALAGRLVGEPDQPLFGNALGQALTPADIAARLTCSALDAGLEDATSLSPDSMRHTCIAWLLRQSMRFSDLSRLVGHLSSEELAAYGKRSPEAHPIGSREVDPIMPALQEFRGAVS